MKSCMNLSAVLCYDPTLPVWPTIMPVVDLINLFHC